MYNIQLTIQSNTFQSIKYREFEVYEQKHLYMSFEKEFITILTHSAPLRYPCVNFKGFDD